MPTESFFLSGSWNKITDTRGDYPAVLDVEPNGLYTGRSAPPGGFLTLDDGVIRKVDDQRLAISTANDAIVTYHFVLNDQTITLEAPDGAKVSYKRFR